MGSRDGGVMLCTTKRFIAVIPSTFTLFFDEGFIFDPDVSSDELGASILQALRISIKNKSVMELTKVEAWESMIMRRFGYKNSRSIFRRQMRCGISSYESENLLVYEPFTQYSELQWRADGDKYEIPLSSEPVIIGEKAREVLELSS